MKKKVTTSLNILAILYLFISITQGQFVIRTPQFFQLGLPINSRSWQILREPQFYNEDIVEKKIEETLPPPEIYSLHIESRIKHRYAQTLVTSRVANPANKSQEVQFTVVLPDTAFISGFKMEIKGKVYKAYVKEKDEAKKIYQDALDSGATAAHVGLSARDSNQFTVSVNVEPNSKVTFNLTYEELLSRILGTYTHAINLNPGQLVRDLVVDVYISESQPITKLHIPELHSGNEVNPEKDEKENPLAKVQWLSKSKTKCHIRYAPTLEQQRIKSKEKDEDALGGQLRVQYDVQKTNPGGEILINEGYFVHFFAPSDLPPLRKLAIFVLDVSGSMEGRKLEQLKQAMNTILDDLPPTDYFNIIEFSYSVTVWNLDTLSASAVFQPESPADGLWWFTRSDGISTTTTPSTTTPLPEDFDVPAYPATPDYKMKAKEVINKMRAGGGTNIHGALKTALLVSKVGFKNLAANNSEPNETSWTESVKTTTSIPTTAENDTPVTTATESTIESDSTTPTMVTSTSAVTSVTTKEINEKEKPVKTAPEPIIIFLTDGDATVGYTKPSKILSMVKELNVPKCAIFSLAFGEGADYSFLRRLSLANSGFARNIYEAADAALQLNSFYKQVASPLLSNITFSYLPGQVVNNSLTLKNFHTLFLGSELVVAGKVTKPQKLEARVCGLAANGPAEYDVLAVRDIPDIIEDTDDNTKGTGSLESNEDSKEICTECSDERDISKSDSKKRKKTPKVPTLERLWAYLTIKQLLDKKHVLDNDSGHLSDPTPPAKEIIDVKKRALRLALKYSFVTALTSLVVVKPNSTTESVDSEKLKAQQHKFFPSNFAARPIPLGLDSNNFDANNPAVSSLHYVPKPSIINKMDTFPENQEVLQFLPLEEVAWLIDIINTDNETVTLPLGVNGTKQQYRIGLNETNTEFQECFSPATTVSESKSHCRHLVHCIIAEIVPSVSEYIRYFCPIPGGYAGVCCPDEEKDISSTTVPITTEQSTDNTSDYTTVLPTSEQDNVNTSTQMLTSEPTANSTEV